MKFPSYEDLSKEQDMIFIKARLDTPVMVSGPPGTGKTVMAFYRAESSSKKKQAQRIIMYNTVLRQYTQDLHENPEITGNIRTWHSWFYGWWRTVFRGRPPQRDDYLPDWDIIKERYLKMTDDEFRKACWGHLIVDEGQDFAREFYELANWIIFNGSKLNGGGKYCTMTVFADENQQLYEENSTIGDITKTLSISDKNHYNLTRNYRNTKPIAEVAKHFYVGLRTGIPNLPEKDGRKPIMKRCGNLEETAKYIVDYARQWDHSIGVFLPTQRIQKDLHKAIRAIVASRKSPKIQRFTSRGGKKYGDAKNLVFDKKHTVTLLCLHSCKGLEFDTVFIPELQEYDRAVDTKVKMQFYVMASRAREHLCFMYSGTRNNPPEILRHFPSNEILENEV